VAGEGRAFGACCFAGKLRSHAGPALAALGRGQLDPYVIRYVNRYVIPYAQRVRTLASLAERIGAGQSPSWGQSAAKTAAD
jgi:hypothetical protein